jgi:hypothetical protein
MPLIGWGVWLCDRLDLIGRGDSVDTQTSTHETIQQYELILNDQVSLHSLSDFLNYIPDITHVTDRDETDDDRLPLLAYLERYVESVSHPACRPLLSNPHGLSIVVDDRHVSSRLVIQQPQTP